MTTPRSNHHARGFRLAGMMAALCAAFSFTNPAQAATDLEVWHALSPYNTKIFEELVNQYNSDQDDVHVVLKRFNATFELENTLDHQVRSSGTKGLPNLVQLDDNRSPDYQASRPYVKPLYSLLANHPIKKADWFIAAQNGLLRDSKGRLMAFPYMLDVPVMFYNIDAFKKAGLSPTVPERSWSGLQAQPVDLANKATRYCPAVSDQPAELNLENLAAVNNQFFTGKNKGKPTFSFDVVYVRHLALMTSWVRSELMVSPGADNQAPNRFAAGECAVLMSDSSNMGWFRSQSGLSFGVAGLPYYPEVTRQPGSPFIDGDALWATTNHTGEEDAATMNFLAWLAEPERAAEWHQQTGFLPLTKQASSATPDDYYKALGQWRQLAAVYSNTKGSTVAAFKVRNYPKIREMFHKTMQAALAGEMPAMTALSQASSNANRLMQEK